VGSAITIPISAWARVGEHANVAASTQIQKPSPSHPGSLERWNCTKVGMPLDLTKHSVFFQPPRPLYKLLVRLMKFGFDLAEKLFMNNRRGAKLRLVKFQTNHPYIPADFQVLPRAIDEIGVVIQKNHNVPVRKS
jgi:hypothetical protein